MNARLPVAAVVLLFVVACTQGVEAREWTDSTGKYRVEAELVDFKDGSVHLRKKNGQVLLVPLEKLSLENRQFVKERFAAEAGKRDGLLVETKDGLFYVDLMGQSERFGKPPEATGRPGVLGNRVFAYADGRIREFDLQGKLLRTVAIRNLDMKALEEGYTNLVVLPKGGFCLLDNSPDEVHFIDARGVNRRTVKMPRGVKAVMQSVHGVVISNDLVISENGWLEVFRVDLRTYQTATVMELRRLGSRLGPIAFHPQRRTYYVGTPTSLYAVPAGNDPRRPNVAQAREVATVETGNICGIVVEGGFAYVTVNRTGKIIKVSLATGETEVLAERLNYPTNLVRLKGRQ